MIEVCHFFLVPSRSSSTPLYPSIVLRARECASTLYSSDVFSLGFPFETLKELGVCHIVMPFGLCNVLKTFQHLMNKVFEPFLGFFLH